VYEKKMVFDGKLEVEATGTNFFVGKNDTWEKKDYSY
jgi:hypothetical protein